MSSNTSIENYIKTHAPHINFLGCYYADKLPTIPGKNSNIIANYCNSYNDNNEVAHWVALINLNSENGCPTMYFDSFGNRPDGDDAILGVKTNFKDYMRRNSNGGSYTSNNVDVQCDRGVSCGHFCVLAVISQSIPTQGKHHGTVWREYVSKYTTKEANENKIKQQIQL